jgi:tetratricopeptide (TPR) repeat protein
MGLIIAQFVCLALFLPFLLKSALMALALALFFLTIFAYFVIREYLLSKKRERIELLKLQFVEAVSGMGRGERTLSGACTALAEALHGREYSYFKAPFFLARMGSHFEKMGCRLHWEDVFRMQEALLLEASAEKIRKVKREPTSLEAHAELAKAYITLSGLYVDPKKVREESDKRWIPPQRSSEAMDKKFRETSRKAIEEFKIIKEYAPTDPWVHEQLAASYRDMRMPAEEIEEYENLLNLRPQHVDTLRKLAELYFAQGQNGKGLKIYEQLRRLDSSQAEAVIAHYGN